MKNYLNFINEERGVSNTVIDYTNILLKIFKINSFCRKEIDLKNSDLPLYSLTIIFEQDLKWGGKTIYKDVKLIDNRLYGIIIHISILDELNLYKIRELLAHELAHVLIFYNTYKAVKKPKNEIISAINSFNYNFNELRGFFYLVYKSTDGEINAEIHNTYVFLLKISPKDKTIIKENLLDCDIYVDSSNMINFNAIDFLKNQKLKVLEIAKIINSFRIKLIQNKVTLNAIILEIDEIDEKLATKQLNLYFYNWQKIFNKQGIKLKEKLDKLIDKVYDDKDKVFLEHNNNIESPFKTEYEKIKTENKLKRLKLSRINKLKLI